MSLTVSVLTGGSNNHETTAERINGIATDFVNEGIVGALTNTSGVAPATGGFAVNAQGSPNMTVAVSAGTAYVDATPTSQGSQTLRVVNSATENVTISANNTGSTKYDWIYISISASNAANPAVGADNVATLVTSRSTSSSSDDGTPPTYGYPIAVVTVANGASSITNGNISDRREGAGVVPGDDTVTTAKIADESITNAKLDTGAGEPGGAWDSWTPSWTNVTVGNGTVVAMYKKVGRTVSASVQVVGGSTTSFANSISFTLPVTAATRYGTGYNIIGNANALDIGVAGYTGIAQTNASTTVAEVRWNASGSYTTAFPFTENTGDTISIGITYESAA